MKHHQKENEERRRRPRGEIKDLGGGCFGIRVQLKERDAHGRRKAHYETVRDMTLNQVERYKDKLLARIDNGRFFVPKHITVSQLVKEWLEQKRRKKLSLQSIHTYLDVTSAYVGPFIGMVYLDDLTPKHIQGLFTVCRIGAFRLHHQEREPRP